jgi:hypothetical protein
MSLIAAGKRLLLTTLHAAQSYSYLNALCVAFAVTLYFHFHFANASTLQYGLLSLHWQL